MFSSSGTLNVDKCDLVYVNIFGPIVIQHHHWTNQLVQAVISLHQDLIWLNTTQV